MLSNKSLCAVLTFAKPKQSFLLTIWLVGQLCMFYQIIVKCLLMLCCMPKELIESNEYIGFNSRSRIIGSSTQSLSSLHSQEKIALSQCNSEISLEIVFRCRYPGQQKAEYRVNPNVTYYKYGKVGYWQVTCFISKGGSIQ